MTDVDKLLEGISTLVRSEFERRLSAMTWRQRGMTLKPLLSRLGCP